MRKTTQRSLLFYSGIIAICTFMLASLIYTSNVPQKQAERGLWVTHTREVIGMLNLIEGYAYKEALVNITAPGSSGAQDASKQIAMALRAIKNLTHDNPIQQKNYEKLQRLILSKPAKQEALFEHLKEMRDQEQKLLIERQRVWLQALANSKMIIVISQLLLFSAAIFAYLVLFRELDKRRQALDSSRVETGRLHGIVALQNAVATENLDINSVMQLVVEQTQKLVKADGSVIEHIDGHEMIYAAASGAGTPFIGLRIPMKGSFSGKAVTENSILKCDDAETDPNVDRTACKRVGVCSMVVVPLLRQGAPFGVLKVFSSERHAFSSKDIDTLEIIAALVSTRINDANSFSAIREVNRELTTQKEELVFTNAQLGELAATDGLTNLRNHRYFMDKLREEFRRSGRNKSIFSLVLIDVDHFKKFNDTFGHVEGDRVLKQVGVILKSIARDTDVVARHGGEEFSLILLDTAPEGAMLIAERLRAAIADYAWDMRAITISLGVSSFNEDIADAKGILENADKALYAAKNAGRNCVHQYHPQPENVAV